MHDHDDVRPFFGDLGDFPQLMRFACCQWYVAIEEIVADLVGELDSWCTWAWHLLV